MVISKKENAAHKIYCLRRTDVHLKVSKNVAPKPKEKKKQSQRKQFMATEFMQWMRRYRYIFYG